MEKSHCTLCWNCSGRIETSRARILRGDRLTQRAPDLSTVCEQVRRFGRDPIVVWATISCDVCHRRPPRPLQSPTSPGQFQRPDALPGRWKRKPDRTQMRRGATGVAQTAAAPAGPRPSPQVNRNFRRGYRLPGHPRLRPGHRQRDRCRRRVLVHEQACALDAVRVQPCRPRDWIVRLTG